MMNVTLVLTKLRSSLPSVVRTKIIISECNVTMVTRQLLHSPGAVTDIENWQLRPGTIFFTGGANGSAIPNSKVATNGEPEKGAKGGQVAKPFGSLAGILTKPYGLV
jgi:hypothetical protein